MIVIDTSAIIALFKGESEAERIAHCIDEADAAALSAANLLEASMVLSGIRSTLEDGDEWLDRLLSEQDIAIEPVTADLAQLARIGFRLYGKGSGHGAALNFGDCLPTRWRAVSTRRCCSRATTSMCGRRWRRSWGYFPYWAASFLPSSLPAMAAPKAKPWA